MRTNPLISADVRLCFSYCRGQSKRGGKTALAKVPDGKIKAAELEKEHGKLIWSFDISMPKSKSITEIQVDAKTGKIVSTQVETPKDQAAEAAADKKAKK